MPTKPPPSLNMGFGGFFMAIYKEDDSVLSSVKTPSIELDKEQDRGFEHSTIGDIGQQMPELIPTISVSEKDYRMITSYAATQEDPQKAMYDASAAILFSRNTGLSADYCLENLETLSQTQIGQPYKPTQTWWKSITNSYKIGDLTLDRGKIGKAYAEARHNGEDYSELEAQMQQLDAEIESLQDYAPRSWATKALKAAAQSLPYTISIAATRGIAGGVAKVATSLIPGIADDIAVKFVEIASSVAGVAKTNEIMWGSMYYDMVNKGIDEDVAWYMSKASGIASGLIEDGLGRLFGGVTRATTQALGITGGSVLNNLVSRMYANGSLGNVGMLLTRVVSTGFGEGSEEFVESIKDKIFENLAYTLSDMEVPVEQSFRTAEGLRNNFSDAAEDFIWGALSGIIMGVVPDAVNVRRDARAATVMKEYAKVSPNYETFSKVMDTASQRMNLRSDTFSDNEMWENAKKKVFNSKEATEARKTAFSKVETMGDIEESETYDSEGNATKNPRFYNDEGEFDETRGGSSPVSVKKMSNGRYFSQESENTTAEGYSIMKFGSPDATDKVSGKFPLYGQIEYSMDDNTLRIEGVRFKNGVSEEDITNMVRQFLRENPDMEIEWEADTKLEESVKSTIEKENNGTLVQTDAQSKSDHEAIVKTLDSWMGDLGEEDPFSARIRQDEQSADVAQTSEDGSETTFVEGADNSEAEVKIPRDEVSRKSYDSALKNSIATVIQMLGEAEGKSGQQWLKSYIKEIRRGTDQELGNTEALKRKGKSHKGLTKLELDETTNEMRAVIYYGKTADASTFLHELNHVVMMQSNHRAEFSEIFNRYRNDSQFREFVQKNWATFKGSFGSVENVDSLMSSLFKGDDWGKDEYEFVASLYEAYLVQRSAFQNKPLAAFFDKITSWMRRVYNSIRGRADLNDEIASFFDRVYGADGKVSEGQSLTFSESDALMYTSADEDVQSVLDQFSDTEARLLREPGNFDEDGNHLAPNGQKSNLTYKQWVLVRTPNFKRWFGDWENDPQNASKVVDANGEPKVVHHGTNKEFDTFDVGDIGFHFGTKEQAARRIDGDGSILDFFLNVRNPVETVDLNEDWITYFIREWMPEHGYISEDEGFRILNDAYERNLDNPNLKSAWNSNNYHGYAAEWIRKWLGENGYDGIIYSNAHEGTGESLVALFANQVKSATNNNGRFSPSEDSFLFQSVDTPQFKEWFKDSKIVDENGDPLVVYHGSMHFFDVFEKRDLGFHFGNKAQAEEAQYNHYNTEAPWFGTAEVEEGEAPDLYDVYLSIQNPIRINEDFGDWTAKNIYLVDYLHDNHYITDEQFNEIRPQAEIDFDRKYSEGTELTDKLRGFLQANGYDGIVYLNQFEGIDYSNGAKNPGYSDSYIAFEPNQIKSASRNSGEYDPNNPSILYQTATSAGTSIVNQIPAAYGAQREPLKRWAERLGFKIYSDGQVNFEQGMGVSDTATDYLKSLGITNIGTDKFNRDLPFNIANAKKAMEMGVDTSSAMNVLNVIDDDMDMEMVIAQSALPLKKDGVAVFQVYEGDRSGVGKYKKDFTQYQRNMKGKDYVPFVSKYYNEVHFRGNVIIATDPKMDEVNKVTGGRFDFMPLETEVSKVITEDDIRRFNEAKKKIPSDSLLASCLFQLVDVTEYPTTDIHGEREVTYTISMNPDEARKYENAPYKKAKITFDFENPDDIRKAGEFNANPERVKDYTDNGIYDKAIGYKYTYINKKGEAVTKNVTFGMMKKKTTDRYDRSGNLVEDNSSSKVYNQPIFALSKGCQRFRILVERVKNGVLPNDLKKESCYGGTCFVNLQRDKIQYGNEYVDTKQLVMPSPDDVDNWFWGKARKDGTRPQRKTIRKFIGDADFIREGAMGDSSHAFPIIEKYGRSLAEAWLENMVAQDIRVTDKESQYYGQPVKTIFITAGYAPVSDESYRRLAKYKDWMEIHVSTSGWFHENELALRMAEFERMNDLGLRPSMRIITNLDNIDGLQFENEQRFLNYIYNRIPVDERRAVPERLKGYIVERKQTQWEKEHPIHMEQILETPYHNDRTGNHSKATGLFGYVCCIPSQAENAIHPNRMTGRCLTCKAGCLARVHNMIANFPNMPKSMTENMPMGVSRETDLHITEPNSFDYDISYDGSEDTFEEVNELARVGQVGGVYQSVDIDADSDNLVSESMDQYFTSDEISEEASKFDGLVLSEMKHAIDYPQRNYNTVATESLLFKLRAEARTSADVVDFIAKANEELATEDEPFALEDLTTIWEDVQNVSIEEGRKTSGTLEEPNADITDPSEKVSQFIDILSDKKSFTQFLNALKKADLSDASLFINNLVARLSNEEQTGDLTSEGFRIAYGQVLENADLYMDLYGQATDNDYWKTSTEIFGDIEEELSSEFNEVTSQQISEIANSISDSDARNALLNGTETNENGAIEKAQEKNRKTIEELLEEKRKLDERLRSMKATGKDVYDARTEERMKAGKRISDLKAENAEISENAADLQRTADKQYKMLLEAQRNLEAKSDAFKADALKSLNITEKELAKDFPTLAKALNGEYSFETEEDFREALRDKNYLSNQTNELLRKYRQLLTAKKNQEIAQKVYDARTHERFKSAVLQKRIRDRYAKVNQALRDAYREREALKRAKRLKMSLARKIMRKVSNNVNWRQAREIREIQAEINPTFAKRMKVGERFMTIDDLRDIYRENADDPIFETMSVERMHRILGINLNDMTIDDLRSVALLVDELRAKGLKERQAYVDAQANAVKAWRDRFIDELLKTGKVSNTPPQKGSQEEAVAENSVKNKLKNIRGSLLNMSRKAQIMDNNTKGYFYDLLLRQKREHEANEYRNIKKRVDPIEALMKEKKVDYSDFYTNHTITIDGWGTQTFTFSSLLYFYLSQNNEKNRQAVAYGNFVTDAEKSGPNGIKARADSMVFEKKADKTEWMNREVKRLGDPRYRQVIEQAKRIIDSKPELKPIIEAIENDFNSDSFERVREVMLKVFNQEVGREEYYLPLRRNSLKGKSAEEQMREDILKTVPGTRSSKSVRKGMTEDRIEISPMNQSSVEADFMKVWADSVADQEHLVEFLEYSKTLNTIFGNSGSSTVLKSYITQAHGTGMMKDVQTHLQEIANPNLGKDAAASDDIIRYLRGGLYSAYLGFKTSSIVNQAITSPAAFLGKVNIVQLMKGYLTMTAHPKEMWNTICELSPMMATRSIDPTRQMIMDERENAKRKGKTGNKVKDTLQTVRNASGFVFGEIGLKGLDWIDRFSVAGGWWAIYQSELAKMNGGDLETNQRNAARIADEYVLETQPLSNKTEVAPLFKDRNQAVQLLTQFQASLNVVWSNITYDIPRALGWFNGKEGMKESLKSGEYKTAIGMIVGYAISGALLLLVTDGFDDDDDDKKKLRKLAYSLFNQPIAGIPLVSNMVDNALKRIVTGEKTYNYSNSLYPAFEKAINIPVNVIEKNWEKALSNTWQTIALSNGLPYSGIKEIMAIKDNGLGALLGRRN